ncbi:MAG: uridine kinase [Simkaniaceae bacterium]|nr:uridine kinase [Simkaniaceae bacterium]
MSNRPILIGISGGTGSGKTSAAKKLLEEFQSGEVVVIEQDSYYKDLAHLDYEDRRRQNFDHPDAIDFELIVEHMSQLIEGRPIECPKYNFATHTRLGDTMTIAPHQVIVFEGILVLHFPALRDLFDIKIYVDTPPDIRFIRRLTRDMQERGRSLQSVIDQYLHTVRLMHEEFVEPTKYFADVIIPEGGHNYVAIDLLRTKIHSILKESL